MTTFSGHCTVRKGQSPFSGQHQEVPDDPEKFWTVGKPTNIEEITQHIM